MGLSASMWTSVSGLLTHGNKMQVVGNNIANVSTIGFKSQRMDFNDYLYLSGSSVSGPTQIGAGVSTYAVIGDYSQGSFESTNSATDIAIDGAGYFGVRKKGADKVYYTRAGDFYFNNDRELQNPEGMVVQGWKVNNDKRLTFSTGATNLGTGTTTESAYVGSGAPTDIVLNSWNVAPQRTTNVQFTMGLENSADADRTTSQGSPMTALFDLWNATEEPPLANEAYATQSSVKVYDEGGTTHELTIYYDQVAASKQDSNGNIVYEIDGLPDGYTMYEYLVTIPPSEDNRSFGGVGYNEESNTWITEPTKFYNDPDKGTSKQAGVLMSGVLVFDSAGQLVDQTAYTYGATVDPGANNQVDFDPANKAAWQPTKFSSNGLPTFTANFTGQPLANSVSEYMKTSPTASAYSQAQDFIMELDLGLKNISNAWENADKNIENVKRDELGRPIDKDGNALGVDEYGYYNLTTNSYGRTKSDTLNGSNRTIYRDEHGFYYTKSGDRVYGTYKYNNAQDAAEVKFKNGGYYYKNAAGDEVPLQADQYGFYAVDNGIKVYGKDANGNITHNGTNFLAGDGSITTADAVPGRITVITSPLVPDTEEGSSSLASLGTNLVDDGLNADGSTRWKITVDYQANVSTMAAPERQDGASICNADSAVVEFAGQDGYPYGTLSTVNIDTNGVVWGYYDNGESLALYQICMYDFHSEQGLYREGGNLFSATRDSGEPRIGVAGDNGFGSTMSYNIEQSNVDLSRELVQMITTQRGFQANSKGITTTDTMLEVVINMKR
ncbi:MAG: flagellar hook-basal body complex protein [Desulfovibrio sp.]|nr:flagellar hook-basal body complex protein [Desulfovibrio sp.]